MAFLANTQFPRAALVEAAARLLWCHVAISINLGLQFTQAGLCFSQISEPVRYLVVANFAYDSRSASPVYADRNLPAFP